MDAQAKKMNLFALPNQSFVLLCWTQLVRTMFPFLAKALKVFYFYSTHKIL